MLPAPQEWKKVWAKDVESSIGGTTLIAPLKPELLHSSPPFKVTTAGISLLPSPS